MATSPNQLSGERWSLLITLGNSLSPVMDGLAFIWLGLTIYELSQGHSPVLEKIVTVIWFIFAVHFFIETYPCSPKKSVLKT